jgi:proline racemase
MPLSDLTVDVPGHGKVLVDIAYGGAFYAFVSAEKLGLDVCSAKTRDLVDAASALTGAVKAQVSPSTTLVTNVSLCGLDTFKLPHPLRKLGTDAFRYLFVLRGLRPDPCEFQL